MSANSDHQTKTLKPLIGARIEDIIVDDEGTIGIVVKKDVQELILWVQMDPEGNGPGWIHPDPMENYKE